MHGTNFIPVPLPFFLLYFVHNTRKIHRTNFMPFFLQYPYLLILLGLQQLNLIFSLH